MVDHNKVYATKQVGGVVECYDRQYNCIATDSNILATMHEHHRVISSTPGWTGGRSSEPGDTLWWDTYETPPEEIYPPVSTK